MGSARGMSIQGLAGVCLLLLSVEAWAVPIDLNDFFADPTVTVASDGVSAVLREDRSSGLLNVVLVNDPGSGDSEVVIAGPGVSLLFEYDFLEGGSENDQFSAAVLDAATGLSIGPNFLFLLGDSGSDSVAFDLSALVGAVLGLEFQLERLSGDTGSESRLTISNVRLETASILAPGTLVLLLPGLVGIRRSLKSSGLRWYR